MGFITEAKCAELMADSQFLFQNSEILISLAFVLAMAVTWIVVYNYADNLSKAYGESKIKSLLINLVNVIAWFCAAMIFYILYVK